MLFRDITPGSVANFQPTVGIVHGVSIPVRNRHEMPGGTVQLGQGEEWVTGLGWLLVHGRFLPPVAVAVGRHAAAHRVAYAGQTGCLGIVRARSITVLNGPDLKYGVDMSEPRLLRLVIPHIARVSPNDGVLPVG
jgi:hypothetical protein